MATFGNRGFEELCVRAHIKSNYCQRGDGCKLALHPKAGSNGLDHQLCLQCDDYYNNQYGAMRASMEQFRWATIRQLIKAACPIGSCRTSDYDCGICGPREENIKKTTAEYFQIQKKACDAYLLRAFGVPRTETGYNNKALEGTRFGFYATWRPFVNHDGKFECNYPAIHLQMIKENAQELQLIKFTYDVLPQDSKARRISRHISSGLSISNLQSLVQAGDESENLLSRAKDVSENLINGVKDGAETLLDGTQHLFQKDGLLRRTPSMLGHKTRRILQNSADKFKGSRLGGQIADSVGESTGKLKEVQAAMVERMSSLKRRTKGSNLPRQF